MFIFIINISIILNTLILCLDMYPASPNIKINVLDLINLIFAGIFFLEMIVKLIGMGPSNYIKDSYNIFDAVIVTISIVDILVT